MSSKSLLLIEKNYSLLNVFKKILERDGYNVYSVVDLAQARDMLEQITPDGVILESELPDGSGIDFCKELRESYSGPILFQSWTGDDESLSANAGASDFLKLPFDMDIARSRIRAMMDGDCGFSAFPAYAASEVS